jgi:hypothetical protein
MSKAAGKANRNALTVDGFTVKCSETRFTWKIFMICIFMHIILLYFFHVLLWQREVSGKNETAQKRSVAVVMAKDGDIFF